MCTAIPLGQCGGEAGSRLVRSLRERPPRSVSFALSARLLALIPGRGRLLGAQSWGVA
ncbi:hypothetical protein G3480_03285 [Thiorhodococcus mannitoliphagus]|uniref:Uncharacterized protein n=1 Tax=Thiorhodococcus mannitoliphagus TaxID=329406 RepID=A0A6P1DUH2_9GAMM|nr:hypothetical protein [Thiorhodococcus mannitoliphagus]NEX19345.1 hypothetical protein [Thiorhodococcus mannitoliphagus]